jgi:hypothetical protein
MPVGMQGLLSAFEDVQLRLAKTAVVIVEIAN